MVSLLSACALAAGAAVSWVAPAGAATAQPSCDGIHDPQAASLFAGQKLSSGQSMNAGGETLVMQADGNLVMYLAASPDRHGPVVWSTHTRGNPGAYAVMQPDGNLVVYRQGGGALWSTGTWGHPNACAELNAWGELWVNQTNGTFAGLWHSNTGSLQGDYGRGVSAIRPDFGLTAGWWRASSTVWLLSQDDGNLVLYRKSDNAPLWSTGTAGFGDCDASMQEDGNFVIGCFKNAFDPLWRSSTGTWGNPGAYALVQDDGNFVIYRQNGGPDKGGALWSSGTWGKV